MTDDDKREFMLNFWAGLGGGMAMMFTLGPLLAIAIIALRCAT